MIMPSHPKGPRPAPTIEHPQATICADCGEYKPTPIKRDGYLCIGCADKRLDAAERFKAYVHDRLDAMGIDPHTEANATTGCRIGPRLDDVRDLLRTKDASIGVLTDNLDALLRTYRPEAGRSQEFLYYKGTISASFQALLTKLVADHTPVRDEVKAATNLAIAVHGHWLLHETAAPGETLDDGDSLDRVEQRLDVWRAHRYTGR